ncbi:hypothetical protein LINGRAHAP2_LOCUS9686 [Linum grandiflorum]
MEWETPSHMVFDKLQFMPLVIQMKEIPYPYSTMVTDLASSNVRFASTCFRVLLVGFKQLFRISNRFGYCFAMRICQRFVSYAVCLAMVTSTALTLRFSHLTEKNVGIGC